MQPTSEVVTLEEVWRLFKETDRKFQEAKEEMQRSSQETDRKFQEAKDEMRRSSQETDRQLQETFKLIKETERR